MEKKWKTKTAVKKIIRKKHRRTITISNKLKKKKKKLNLNKRFPN